MHRSPATSSNLAHPIEAKKDDGAFLNFSVLEKLDPFLHFKFDHPSASRRLQHGFNFNGGIFKLHDQSHYSHNTCPHILVDPGSGAQSKVLTRASIAVRTL